MPRFAILIHDHPALHWDFLLENGEKCRTWRLLDPPDAMNEIIRAEQIPDHRLLYLEYEGPVSGDRGAVTQWDVGSFEWLKNEANECVVQLEGHRWRCRVRLVRESDATWSCYREGNNET